MAEPPPPTIASAEVGGIPLCQRHAVKLNEGDPGTIRELREAHKQHGADVWRASGYADPSQFKEREETPEEAAARFHRCER